MTFRSDIVKGGAAVIILIFGEQQEKCNAELHRRRIFPVRRLCGGPVWHKQNGNQTQPGTGKQLCPSPAAQSDQTVKGRTGCCSSEPKSRAQKTLKTSVQILPAVPI